MSYRAIFVALVVLLSSVGSTAGSDGMYLDDFDHAPYLWQHRGVTLSQRVIPPGDPLSLPGQTEPEPVLEIGKKRQPWGIGPQRSVVTRALVVPEDWRGAEGIKFWFFGRGTRKPVTVSLYSNRWVDTEGWRLVWRDEFSGPPGPFNPTHWSAEVGDGSAQGNPGWGNQELEYYTGDPGNAAIDGRGHLAITARLADSSLSCYYGPCLYTSARLVSANKVEVGYGRIEARLRVPSGAGLWPAFWSLGRDFESLGWPSSGEIDFLEFVGREPSQVFGAIHGPGYSGAEGVAGNIDLGVPVSDAFHEVAVEWNPEGIEWSIDGVVFHSATPADVAPDEWVFDKPFSLLLNLAVGGDFAGPVDSMLEFPKTMLVDYIRVFQRPGESERFEATFVDDAPGWKEVALPFAAFQQHRAGVGGGSDVGLNLEDIWGYGFDFARDAVRPEAPLFLDTVALQRPTEIVVSSLASTGPGSLLYATEVIADGGRITFDPALAGETIFVAPGEPLWISGKSLVIDAADAPGLTLSGDALERLMIVEPDADVEVHGMKFADGSAVDLAGGILNNGSLTLDGCVVSGNVVESSTNDYWKGGGGIYSGTGSVLRLMNTTVADNEAASFDGGGLFAFFDADVTVENSTFSGNIAGNVGGAIRMIGNGVIINSTLSGNEAVAWHGAAVFSTDGVLELIHTTVSSNVSPADTSAVFVGTFTEASASLILASTLIDHEGPACFVGAMGSGTVTYTSEGGNLSTDASCATAASDQFAKDVGLDALADNGGPTLTHALLPESPAIDMAEGAYCTATDQRGMPRTSGGPCDVGAFELP